MITGLGMTEASPTCTFTLDSVVRAGYVGLPVPGCTMKLVPVSDKREARFSGPHVTPGYFRNPAQSKEAFDRDGFYCTGDALKPIDEHAPELGFLFDGRLAEDFKLSSGTFVSVGPLRAKLIAEGAPYVQDVVVAGINRAEIAVLIFPRLDDCRRLAGSGQSTPAPELLEAAPVREFFQALLDRVHATATGSANRVACLHLLREPPSIDKAEITDKNSINQRAVLGQRSALVEAIYEGTEQAVLRPSTRS
jgi:feruloyl-CoA synthase